MHEKHIEILENIAKNGKDYQTIKTRYIHPEYGYYFLYRSGVADAFSEETGIGSAQERLFDFGSNSDTQISWRKPTCLCDNASWQGKGISITREPYTNVQEIMRFNQKYENGHYTKKQKEKARILKTGIFVLVNTAFNAAIYIKKINGRWVITHIDTVVCDCSA